MNTDLALTPWDFEEALRILREHGHTKNRSTDENGRVCAARALNMAYGKRTNGAIRGPYPAPPAGVASWYDVMRLMELPDKFTYLPQWNDLPSTSQRDVELRFTAAAKNLRHELLAEVAELGSED